MADRAAALLVGELVLAGFTPDDALGIVGFPRWTGETEA